MKRLFDIVMAAAALLILAPLMLLVALAVRLFLGAPILFRQVRPGLRGAPFEMLKFRTMTDRVDPSGNLLPDEERLNGFGTVLRAYSLDELPELVNVLRGEMSLVGPRPLLMEYLEHYTPEQRRRHDVRPGITGWAQVNGRNALSWEEKFHYDLFYVDNRSFLFDLRIVWLTLRRLLRPEGINAVGSASMPRFEGSRKDAGSSDD